uniref:dual-specificity kinase n=1 Tax=Chrysotila carterae TaxID=13221 RepID=A0A7S4B584_CHRCT
MIGNARLDRGAPSCNGAEQVGVGWLSLLSEYEQREIAQYPEVHFTGAGADKVQADGPQGFADSRGDYKVRIGDHFAYRFEAVRILGRGAFGQVVHAHDHKEGSDVALKIGRSKKRAREQAAQEIEILQLIISNDPHDKSSCVRLLSSFSFRGHACLCLELLSSSLFDLLKGNGFRGISLTLIRRFAIQLVNAMLFLKKIGVIHFDIKPENIMLREPGKSAIKLVDFGNSCLVADAARLVAPYVQSRYYRSPEVLLGLELSHAVDCWSCACVLAELFMGSPLFKGADARDQLARICGILGAPPPFMLRAAAQNKGLSAEGSATSSELGICVSSASVADSLGDAVQCTDADFLSFLGGCLRWEPTQRFSPEECLQHDWLTAASKVPAADVTPVQAHHASLTKPRAWPQSEDSRNASRHDLAHCCPTEGPDWFSGSVSSTGWRQPLRGYGTKRPALPTILPPISMQTSLLSLAGQDGTKGQLI